MKARWILAAGGAMSAVMYVTSSELTAAARITTALLIGVFPALASVQAAAVAAVPKLPSRMQLYASTLAGLWGLTVITAFVVSESGIGPRLTGVVPLPWADFAIWTAIALAAVFALVLAFKAFGMRETNLLQHLIPATPGEKLVYVLVSLSAGLCEEFVFRGFLVGTLRVATGSVALATVLSAAAFGIAHAHQNPAGALRAALLGLVLTVPLLMTGSLYPGIAAHAIVDVVGGLWLSRWLLRSE
jgi:uncharacterized protein